MGKNIENRCWAFTPVYRWFNTWAGTL